MTQQLNPDDAPDGYVAVAQDDCAGCAFEDATMVSGCSRDPGDSTGRPLPTCAGTVRSDDCNVIFVKRTPLMANGLTEAETAQTASVAGLSAAAPVEKAAPSTYSEWSDFYAGRITEWLTLDGLRAEVAKLATVDAPNPERLLIHAMHLLEAQQAAQPVAPIKQGLTPAAQPVAEVGDLIIQVRERVTAAGARNRDPLYTADQMRAHAAAARRQALEEAAREAEHWQNISTTPGHACGQYIAAAIRSLIDKDTA